jgi:hypothetical protein
MLQSRPLLSLLLVSGIVSASWACSSAPDEVIQVPTAGTGSTAGGSGNSAGTASVPTAGTNPTTGGTDSGQAGSQASAGSGGMVVAMGGTGGGTSGGTGGGPSGGTGGGAAGGAAGGTGGGANTTFCGTDAGKVALFDGTEATFKSWYPRNGGMSAANPWTFNAADGTMTVKGSDIISKMGFQNVCLHLEYQAPKYTYSAGTDAQERGNSGVYLKASWEAQVLDTFDLGKTQNDFCGAIYKVAAPLVSACKTGGEWNSYDIEFQANVCTGTMTTTPAKFVKVNLNGVNIHNNVAVPAANATEAGLAPTCEARGVLLQNHSSVVPVSFRNIWAIPRQ